MDLLEYVILPESIASNYLMTVKYVDGNSRAFSLMD
jgi:hypothetical protein